MTAGGVFILGAGRAGRGLSRALRASGIVVAGLHGRRAEQSPDAVSAGTFPAAARQADTVIVAVRDSQLDDALGELAGARLKRGAVVLHASGSSEPPGLAALRGAGHPCGTFHPLVPLADPARSAELIRGAWIGIDGDEAAIARSRALAAALGARTLRIPAGEKPTYHAAAVIASNFPTVLAALAAELLAGIGIAEGDAWPAVRALMHGAVANLDGETPARALTGPIARGDVETVRKHVAALASHPATAALYRALSAAAVEIARSAGTSGRALGEITAVLAADRQRDDHSLS
jgi:predicted short-subunit dehydrogenase-like oxidoreductase (DUF2520 family)